MAKAVITTGAEQMELNLEEPRDSNPFSEALSKGLTTRVRRTKTDTPMKAIVDLETNVIEGAAEICKIEEVDPEQFMKVFSAQLGALYTLPGRATKLLITLWDAYSREAKKRKETAPLDYVEMSLKTYEDMASKNGGGAPSKPTYHRAIKDLMESGIISAAERPGKYWINPAVFFIGSRIRLVQEIRRAPEITAGRPSSDIDTMRDVTPARQTMVEADGTVLDAETGEVIGHLEAANNG